MSIEYTPSQWERLRRDTDLWWQGTLERPLVVAVLTGRDPRRPQPEAPLLNQETCTDFRWSPEELVDRIDYELSKLKFLGDAFPYFNLDCYGPGVMAAMVGARLDNSSGRVWFFPKEEREITDIHIAYDPDNEWLVRVRDFCRAAMDRWQGQVLVGMPDLGGALDVLSTFRPSEKLLMDLYDHPEEVERLTWEIHEVWHQLYEEINTILQPVNPGYSDWSYIYSSKPSYILQCDFSYMISPRMFKRFALPELAASCRWLDRSIYHLDGVGEIPHLDMLLSIPELDAVQWIPGDGKPDCSNWPELYQRIEAAGKRMQVLGDNFGILDAVVDQIGTKKGIHFRGIYGSMDQEQSVRENLARYGIE
jgi:hypothetical protein